MAPKIYKKWETLKDKLLQIDKLDIDGKEVGREHTLAIEFIPIDIDPEIPKIPQSILDRWIEARQRGEPLNLGLSSSENRPSRKPIVKSRPKHSDQKSTHKQQQSTPTPSTAAPGAELSSPVLSEASTKQNQLRETIDIKSTQNSTETIDLRSTQNSPEISNDGDVVCRGYIDKLVVREPIDDEYRCSDDDFEPDTQLQKTLKKIRTDPVTSKEQKSSSLSTVYDNSKKKDPLRPTPPTPLASRPTATVSQPKSPLPVDPKPQPPPKPREPDWNETAKQLQLNQFDNVYKDLKYFKDRISSDDKAKKLLLDAAIKCLTEDDTTQLIDMLDLIYSFDFHKDNIQYWSELLLRLKRKVQPNSLYKSKTDKENVRRAYCYALDGVLKFAISVNLNLTLRYNDMIYFATSQHNQPSIQEKTPTAASRVEQVGFVMTSGPTTSELTNTTDKVVEDKSHDLTKAAANGYTPIKAKVETKKEPFFIQPMFSRFMASSLDIKPDVKPGVKQDKQENVDPSTVRRVTLVKDAEGKPSFKIVRPRNANASILAKRKH